jgi:hypothetical protein
MISPAAFVVADELEQGSELGSMPPFTAEQTQLVVQQQQQVQSKDDDKKECGPGYRN